MTKSQRDAIVSPVAGLLVYQTNNAPGFYFYNGTGQFTTAVGYEAGMN